MTDYELTVTIWFTTAYVWGIVTGFILHRGFTTGKWSLWP